jgi:serine/threonine protein kinase
MHLIDPQTETNVAAFCEGLSNPKRCTVRPYDAAEQGEQGEKRIFVMRALNPQKAYIETERPSECLDRHAPGWGNVHTCMVVTRVEDDLDARDSLPTFQYPAKNQVQYVSIKKLGRSVVAEYLANGGQENPNNEVSRMQQYGHDNLHVVGCIEALYDATHLYIVSPRCESLQAMIPWGENLVFPEFRVCAYFVHLLQVLQYLQREGICHRNLSSDKMMIYQGRLVVSDLGMSFRIPPPQEASAPQGGPAPATVLVRPFGCHGEREYLAPEVRHNFPFNPHACDLWSSIVILFTWLTSEILYEDSHPENLKFLYFVQAGGCSRTPINELTAELQDTHVSLLTSPERASFQRMVAKVKQLSPEVLELFEGVLQVNPQNRWNLDQVIGCEWIRRHAPQWQLEQQQQQSNQVCVRRTRHKIRFILENEDFPCAPPKYNDNSYTNNC